jgi:ankyrin repeat protein
MYRFYDGSKSDDSEDDSPPNVVAPPSTVVPPPSTVVPPRPPPSTVPPVSKIKLAKDNPPLYRSLCNRLLSAIHKNDIIEVKEAILQGADPNCTGELPAFIYGLSMYEIYDILEDYPLLAATNEYYNKPFVIPPPAPPPPLEDFDTKLMQEIQPLLNEGMDYEDAFRIAKDIVRKRHRPPPVPFDRFSITYLPRNPEDYEYKKRFEIIKILIDAGADVNCTNKKFSVLEYIGGMNDSNVIKLLLENGADVNYVNSFGGALLHTHINNVEVVNLLLSKGANINVKNQRGETPLFLAADYKYIEVVKLLLDKGADPNIKNQWGETPLFRADNYKYIEVAKLLLAKGVDINVKNQRGETPLFIAVKDEFIEVIKLLLAKGADPNIKNNNGETPLFLAVKNKYIKVEVVKLLLSKGADPSTITNYGQTAYDVANPEIKFILKKWGPTMAAAALQEHHVYHLLDFWDDFNDLDEFMNGPDRKGGRRKTVRKNKKRKSRIKKMRKSRK